MKYMPFRIATLCIYMMSQGLFAQTTQRAQLSVAKIMQDPKSWIGTSPSDIQWSDDSKTLFFNWNPEQHPGDSIYKLDIREGRISKAAEQEQVLISVQNPYFNTQYTKKLYLRNGDMFERDLKKGRERQLSNILNPISSPRYDQEGNNIYFIQDDNLFKLHGGSGTLEQLTNFKQGTEPGEKAPSPQDAKLEQDQLAFFEILRQRKETKEQREAQEKRLQPGRPKPIYTGKASVSNVQISPDERYITYNLITRPEGSSSTEVPSYVTESGYTEMLTARSKVGSEQAGIEMGIYDRQRDTTYTVNTADLPGLDQLPEFANEYQDKTYERMKEVMILGPVYPKDGSTKPLIEIRSLDNKDRWIALLDFESAKPRVLDHQRDEAWIAGPGIGWIYGMGDMGWMPDHQRIWYQSEESGYSHLYTLDVGNGTKKQLTAGQYEVYEPSLSRDGKTWYFHANMKHPGERHFYRMPADGGEIVQLTSMEGRNDVTLSPNEKTLAIIHSFANRPPELYLQANKADAQATKHTNSLSEEWQQYPWRTPEFVTFTASDGTEVPARLYKPEGGSQGKPAVVFVHGAGYLQNAHKWWSSYFREYMFHNLLADKGYTVLDIDYRGSAGYGRDWRTAIYRHMGGKDLSDQVDGVNWLVQEHGADRENIGIYGGSYGGFITLMAMFTEPGVFKSGAALRSVTDWAHYNHAYTSNILNEPYTDSLAYARSSPIYYAEGLEGNLLICHGMIDTNVHFQDVVRLSQRLIELGKENWELAVYPLEDHGFVEPSSWTDEYRRILELFESTLKPEKEAQDN